MKQFLNRKKHICRPAALILLASGLLAMAAQAAPPLPQQVPSPTPPPLRVEAYNQDVNVRAGPHTYYDLIGVLVKGQASQIVGRSANSMWLQIVYVGAPGGVGWVNKDVVRVVGDVLSVPVVAAPPTPTLPPTPVGDGLPVAATPTPVRLPTFTPPPAVVRPTLLPAQGATAANRLPPALFIAFFGTLGVSTALVSLLRRR